MFGRGVLLGVAIAAAAVLVFNIWEGRDYELMYRDMGSAQLPAMTKVVLAKWWRLGAPVAAIVAVAALVFQRPRSWIPYALAVVAILVALAFSWYAIRLPIWQLADAIR
jgi:hypothetical protein